MAVAKVGILTFADYIHDIYIADGGWKEDTWNWIFDPGYTLVDLVDAALGAIGSAISMIKAGVTSVMNAVKSGMEWLANTVLDAMVTGIVTTVNTMLDAFFIMLDAHSSDITYQSTLGSNSYSIGL